ncbi:MAG TPA: hypothetical protein VGA02_04070 [Gemmatimonadales bacterium]|jgi:hypothetical protein
MSFSWGLRIVAVVMMGWVVAHAARVILMSIGGHDRLTTRALVGEALTGVGAFLIGWALLPGGTADGQSVLMLLGCLVWAAGIVTQPPARAPSGS